MLTGELLDAMGGKDNIVNVERAITRLRFSVRSTAVVDEAQLRRLGAYAVVIQRQAVQVILGPQAGDVADDIAHQLPGIEQL